MNKFTTGEQHIINGSPEISVGEAEGWTDKILTVFPALRSRDYKLFFYGGLVSLIGTWLQIVAEGWLVLTLTHSAFLIGLVAAIATLPTLLFSLFGGVIVDRFPKRKILIFTQTASMILAILYGLLTVSKLINIWEILVLAFLLGVITALDSPARQAFTVEMVKREDIGSAISLNSGAFNGARVIGPGIAGFIIALVGPGGAFLLNGLSYIAVIFALLKMRTRSIIASHHQSPLRAIKEGITYSYSHPIIRTLLIFAGVTSVFGWSYSTEMSYIAKNSFHLGAEGLGYLYAASGLGALVATFLVSFYSKRVSPLIFILGGSVVFCFSILGFSVVTSVPLAMVCLFIGGVGLLSQFAMMNTTVQHMVEDKYRGRVMSIYTVMFLGLSPLGNIEVGYLSEHLGTGTAIRIGAIIVLLFTFMIYVNRNKIRIAHEEYKVQLVK